MVKTEDSKKTELDEELPALMIKETDEQEDVDAE